MNLFSDHQETDERVLNLLRDHPEGINVLSLFDGMSCGRIALERAGIKVKNYYASEVDKYPIQIAMKNYSDTIQIGDVCGVKASDLPEIHLVIGGSPCQGFSFAGKQLNFEDPRSKLFFEYVRLLKELKPVCFLLENVKMKKESEDIITQILSVKPIVINSALVSAQNRRRLYWTNIPGIKQPSDKGILLKEVLEDLGYPVIKNRGELAARTDKSQCLDANYYKGVDNHGQRTVILYLDKKEIERAKHKYSAKVWKSGNRMGNMQFPDRTDKKARSLTATIIKGARETMHIQDECGIRLLTPLECERLQTIPEGYTEGVSNTQRYKMLGNGWTIDVIAHIFSFIKP